MSDSEGGQSTGIRLGHWLIVTALAVSFGYLLWAGWRHLQGEQGVLRGAILFFGAAVFGLGKTLEPGGTATFLKRGVLLVFALGVFDLILHSPGCSMVGLDPRYSDDFEINLTASHRLYDEGGVPYGIQEEFDLPNASISFPFPTYWIYWACSGFGLFDQSLTGGVFTALNLMAAMLLICRSFRLAGMRTKEAEMFWFLLFISPLWGALLIGQTPVMAAACIVVGWLHTRSEDRRNIFLGIVLVGLGVLIKPNFAPVLLGLAVEWWVLSNCRRGFLTLASVVAIAFLMIVGTLLIPGGVSLETFESFREIALPRALTKVEAPNNVSLAGLFIRVFHASVSPSFLALCLGLLSTAFGLWRKLDWRYWLLVPLLISPITWSPYLALVLPVEFALVGQCGRAGILALIIAAGLIAIGSMGMGTVGLLILSVLVVTTPQEPLPGKS